MYILKVVVYLDEPVRGFFLHHHLYYHHHHITVPLLFAVKLCGWLGIKNKLPFLLGSSRDCLVVLVGQQTCDQKVADSCPGRSSRIIVFSVVSFLCLYLPMLNAVAHTQSRSFCKKCRWQLQLNTPVPHVCGFE